MLSLRTETIVSLRAAMAKRTALPMAMQRVALGHGAADLCLKGGLARGALHEVWAETRHEAAATGFAAAVALRLAGERQILWLAQDFAAAEFGALSPPGLVDLGFDPNRLILFRAAKTGDALRAAGEALACPGLGAVVIEIVGAPRALDLTASRRLALLAEHNGLAALLLRFGAAPQPGAGATRWLIRAAASAAAHDDVWGYPVFAAELIRHRNGETGHWLMEWNCDARLFQTPAPHRGAMVSAPADRPAATA